MRSGLVFALHETCAVEREGYPKPRTTVITLPDLEGMGACECKV